MLFSLEQLAPDAVFILTVESINLARLKASLAQKASLGRIQRT